MNNFIVNLLKSQCSVNKKLFTNIVISNHRRIFSQNVIKRNFASKPKQEDNISLKPNCNVGKLY